MDRGGTTDGPQMDLRRGAYSVSKGADTLWRGGITEHLRAYGQRPSRDAVS